MALTAIAKETRAQLEKILASPRMESSPSLSQLLRYVVEETLAGRGHLLKEYSLGAGVFGRGESFDPRMDPIVRVQARNLRSRLADYYAGPGAEDAIVIELPKRTYVPLFHGRDTGSAIAAGAGPETAELPAAPPVADPRPGSDLTVNPLRPQARGRAAGLVVATLLAALLGTAGWLVAPEIRQAADRPPDTHALDLYVRARRLIDRQTEPELRRSIELLQEAVGRDPRFAAAHASLADAYNMLAQYGYIAPSEGMQHARRWAERAIAINPRLAEGYVSLAAVIEAYDWNWAAAERQYRRAVQLNPSLPAAHLWLGMFLRDQDRLQEALPELRRAAQLDPHSLLSSINLAHALIMNGDYDAAAELARHVVEQEPRLISGYVILSNAYRAQSLLEESNAVLAQALERAGDDPHSLSVMARALAARDRPDESRVLFRRLDELARQRYVSPFDLGTVSLVLGEEDRALAELQEAFRQRSSGLIFLRNDKFASRMRSPAFQSLIEKMRFTG